MSRIVRQIATLVTIVASVGAVFIFSNELAPSPVYGQGNNGNNNNNNNNNSGGIRIDASGVVSLAIANDASGTLDKKRREAAAKQTLSSDLNRPAKTRYVSLVGVERAIDQALTEQKPLPDELFFLAGLQQIEEIFVLPETQDLVIAGPAEGFARDAVGRMIGVESGRATLRLDDLAVALRTQRQARQVGCSIDPVPDRLAELQRFIQQGGPATANVVEARFNQMDDILGLQLVRVDGVPAESHFGIAFVEADYRMKRISMGLENPGVKGLKSHLAMLGGGGNAIQRWWFVPLYDAIYRSPDGLAYRFAGQRLQLLAEEEMSDAQGHRSAAPTTRISTKAFARQFTDKFPELAKKSPVFSELQNLTDWVVLAALIQKERLADKIDWKMTTLLDETRLSLPAFNAPQKVPSMVNYKRAGNSVIGLVGGGVTIQPQQTVAKLMTEAPAGQRLDAARQTMLSSDRGKARWWWDAP